ncbi:hypothetical protein [Rhodobacter sp. CZR27]|uniref:hypothetical protein n=1 Tax=Rhodobacter sp. CZR27 TaxID=2033869 RepID=UPI001E5D504F|nr:hypothetical protein [Rhodobacter sp. CZR27]
MQAGDGAIVKEPDPAGSSAMAAGKSVLVIGHSHVGCLAAAARTFNSDKLEVISVANVVGKRGREELPEPEIVRAVVNHARLSKPDALCLCIRGNQHNILGITENPTPFSIGEAEFGSAPREGSRRHFIPYQLMKAHFRNIISRDMIHELYNSFPDAARYYLNAPPPVSDWDYIQANPSSFSEELRFGPSPHELKLQLYRCQTEVLRECAEAEGARFIDIPPQLCDRDGFLARHCYGPDPTHANTVYGEIVLKTLLDVVGASK